MKFRNICTYVLALVLLVGVCVQTGFAGIEKTRDAIKADLAKVEKKADKNNATYQKILAVYKKFESDYWQKDRDEVYEEIGALYDLLVPYAKSIDIGMYKPDWLD